MKKMLSGFLSLALAAMLTPAISGVISADGHRDNVTVSQPIFDSSSREIAGAGPWSKFINGVACGAGIVAIAGGALSGVGAAGAVLAVTGVAAACVQAFD